jgi:hypothetical protein
MALPRGTSSAAIHVTESSSGRSSFSGTVADRDLSGNVVSSSSSSSSSGSSQGAITNPAYNYAGDLGGHRYALHVSLNLANAQTMIESGRLSFTVSGTYGSEAVKGTAAFELAGMNNSSSTLHVLFDGRIGNQSISGVATASMGSGHSVEINAPFTVH